MVEAGLGIAVLPTYAWAGARGNEDVSHGAESKHRS